MMNSEDNKRIVKNTFVLYFRQIITLIVSLFTSRIILQTLGVTDYGINDVVGGMAVMIGFFSNGMVSMMERFYAYAIGRNDSEELKLVFCMSIIMQIILGIAVIVLAETFGCWFLHNKLMIPAERMDAANWVFQFKIFSFFVGVIVSAYTALIIAQEDMHVFGIMSIFDVAMRLLIACLLMFFGLDKLKLLSVLDFGVYIVVAIIYTTYCKKKYPYLKFRLSWNAKKFREMLSFAVFSMIRSIDGLARTQITGIILNMFFGPIVNAAYGITRSVELGISTLANNVRGAASPQVIKLYARDETDNLLNLSIRICKITYFLMFLMILPVILEAETVLCLWLGKYPEQTPLFMRLALVSPLISVLFASIVQIINATGNINRYALMQIAYSILYLFVVYFVLKMGFPPAIVFVAIAGTTVLQGINAVIFVKKLTNFPLMKYLLYGTCVSLLVSFVAAIVPSLIHFYMGKSLMRFFVVSAASIASCGIFMWFIGLNRYEKEYLLEIIKRKTGRLS